MRDGLAFFMCHLSTPILVSGMESDFGILPFPKLYEEQKEYYSTFQYNSADAIAIPKTADLDFVPLITEAYEMYAHDTILPAFYDYTLTLRAARDEQSGEMLEIIYGNRNLDIAFANYGTTNVFNVLQNGALGKSFRYVSLEKQQHSAVTQSIETIIETLKKLDA